MNSPPATLPIHLPPALLAELNALGGGDSGRGALVALEAAKVLAETREGDRIDPDAPLLRLVHATVRLTEAAELVSRHIERYELERRAFLDDVARIGRMEEDRHDPDAEEDV